LFFFQLLASLRSGWAAQVFVQSGPRERALTASLLAGHFFTQSEITQITSAVGILRPSAGMISRTSKFKKSLTGFRGIPSEKNEEATPELMQAVSYLDPKIKQNLKHW